MKYCLCLLLLFTTMARADISSATLAKAERLFNEQMYSDALPLYEEMAKQDSSADLQCRLIQTYFELGHYDHVIEVASHLVPAQPQAEGHKEILFLKGQAYKKLGRLSDAHQAFAAYLSSKPTAHRLQAVFELGLIDFTAGKLEDAKQYFSAQESSLSRLYLARIALLQGHQAEALASLRALKQSLSQTDLLNQEVAYWLGTIYFDQSDYLTAAAYFEETLPQQNPASAEWYHDTLYRLGKSYLKAAETPSLSKEQQRRYFDKAEKFFDQLIAAKPEENAFLALGEFYLIKARYLENEASYLAAEALLSKQEHFVTPLAKSKALLLRAQAAHTYVDRVHLYRSLTDDNNSDNPLYAQGWYMRGLNDYEEGLRLGKNEDAKNIFENAAAAFNHAAQLFKQDPSKMAQAIKYQALALFHQQTDLSKQEAFHLLDQLIHQQQEVFESVTNKAEFFYLAGLFTSNEAILKEGIERYPDDEATADIWNLLGHLYQRNGRDADAEQAFVNLATLFPSSPLAGESLFWAAACADHQKKDETVVKEYRRRVFENYPKCRYAPEAYLAYYPYREYLQGSRTPLKHLDGMSVRHPKSPLTITSHYLIGLDHKKDRLSLEGKIVRRKNMLAAIDAFQEAETAFDTLNQEGLINADSLEYFVSLRYRSTLERALSNLSIAEESEGAKRQIYLEYAEDVFKQVIRDFNISNHALTKLLLKQEPYPRLWEESDFWLAHTLIQKGDDNDANNILGSMIEKYRLTGKEKGYYPSRVWYEKGIIAMRSRDFLEALKCLGHAEKASEGNVLSTDQKLDLWIQQSLCYKEQKKFDQAMLLLSQVINDDAISGLRLKAMYLRAEIYELQGRQELALKQWDATAKRGGEWGQKAKELLKIKLKDSGSPE